ncbi:MAG: glycosyltransferase family 87 protein [Planctomycetaceae bacterium]
MDAFADSNSNGFPISRRWIAVWLVIAAAVAAAMAVVKDRPGDSKVYALGAERMLAGERVYRPEEDSAFTYPPFCGLYFVPLSPLSEPVRRGCFYFANFVLLGTIVFLVIRQVGPVISAGERAGGPPMWAYFTIVAALSARFLVSPIENQAHDLILLALMTAAIVAWGAAKNKTAGLWAGLATATKATPLLFLPIFLWQRRFSAAGALVVVTAAATLLPDFVLPQKNGERWAMSWYGSFVSKVGVGQAADAEGAWRSWNMLNQSLAGTVHRLSTPISPAEAENDLFDVSVWSAGPRGVKTLTLLAQLAVLGWLALVTWEPKAARTPAGPTAVNHLSSTESMLAFRRLGQGSAILCAMLLLSPMSSKQHFCALFLPIAWCTAHVLYRRRDRFVMAALAFVFVSTTLLVKDVVGRPLGNLALGYGSLTFATIACFAATGYVLVQDRAVVADRLTDRRQSGSSDETCAAEARPAAA